MDGYSSKRARSHSSSEELDPESRSTTQSPSAKLQRLPTTGGEPSKQKKKLICTLPPTCCPPNPPSRIANSTELERHYALYHAHVCEVKGCSCVFPEARLLELHLSECHDPLSEVRKERGEKTFACFLPPSVCSRVFLTPKARRLHLIQSHGYPKEYFFAVTNKGIGGLLKKWGEGASLVRGQWRSRDESKSIERDEEYPSQAPPMEIPGLKDRDASLLDDDPMEELSSNLHSLSLVPDKIRFGRGGKTRGFTGSGRKVPRESEVEDIARFTVPSDRKVKSFDQHSAASVERDREVSAGGDLSLTRGGAMPREGEWNAHRSRKPQGPVENSSESNFVTINTRGRGRGRLFVP